MATVEDTFSAKTDFPAGSTKTLVKALALLQAVSECPGDMSLTSLSQATGLPKATAYRLLTVLSEWDLVRADQVGAFWPGVECLRLGRSYLDSLDLRREALDLLKQLANSTGETCHLGVREGNRIVYVEKVEVPRAMRIYSRIGRTNPVHCTAMGKAMLAHSSSDEVQQVLSGELERRTPNTLVDPLEIRAELARIHACGYALDNVENEEGIRCVAAPVFDHEGTVIAAVSAAGSEYHITLERVEEFGILVREAGLALSRHMGYEGDLPVVVHHRQSRLPEDQARASLTVDMGNERRPEGVDQKTEAKFSWAAGSE